MDRIPGKLKVRDIRHEQSNRVPPQEASVNLEALVNDVVSMLGSTVLHHPNNHSSSIDIDRIVDCVV